MSLIALAVILYFVDLGEVRDDLLHADYRYLIPILVLDILALFTRAYAWRIMLMEAESFRDVFLALNAGYLLNIILPLRLGELGRALILGRHGLGFWRVLSTILVERAFDFAIIAGMLFISLPFVTGASQALQIAIAVIVMVALGFLVLYLVARNKDRVLLWYKLLTARWPRFRLIGEERLNSFISGLEALTDFRRFLRVLFWMLVNWGLAALAHYLLLLAFVPEAKFYWIVFGLAVAALGVALPSAPAFIGVLEAAWVGALTLVGVEPSTALAFAVTSHLINIVVTGGFGAYAFVHEGESLVKLYSSMRNQTS